MSLDEAAIYAGVQPVLQRARANHTSVRKSCKCFESTSQGEMLVRYPKRRPYPLDSTVPYPEDIEVFHVPVSDITTAISPMHDLPNGDL